MTAMTLENRKEKINEIGALLKEWGFELQLGDIEEIWEVAEQAYRKDGKSIVYTAPFNEYFLNNMVIKRIPLSKKGIKKAGGDLFKKDYPEWFLEGVELEVYRNHKGETRCYLSCHEGIHTISRSLEMNARDLAVFEEKVELEEYLLVKAFDSEKAKALLKDRVVHTYMSIEQESKKSDNLKELTQKVLQILAK